MSPWPCRRGCKRYVFDGIFDHCSSDSSSSDDFFGFNKLKQVIGEETNAIGLMVDFLLAEAYSGGGAQGHVPPAFGRRPPPPSSLLRMEKVGIETGRHLQEDILPFTYLVS